MHLEQLKLADAIEDRAGRREFPNNQYNSRLFCALRNLTDESEINFIKKNFCASVDHNSFTKEEERFLHMDLRFGAQ
jgi:hypothetical protein